MYWDRPTPQATEPSQQVLPCRPRRGSTFALALLAALAGACASETTAPTPDRGIDSTVALDSGPDLRQVDSRSADTTSSLGAVRVLLLMSTTASMDVSDPRNLRISEPKRAFDLLTTSDGDTAFALMSHAASATLLQDFSSDAAALNSAADKLAALGGNLDFVASLADAEAVLETDMKRTRSVPNDRTAYVVFFFTDNLPENTSGVLKAVANLKTLANNQGVAGFRFHTALLIDPTGYLPTEVHDAILLPLKQMAKQASGKVIDYLEGETFPFDALITNPLN